jgi:hypothetical protein
MECTMSSHTAALVAATPASELHLPPLIVTTVQEIRLKHWTMNEN